MPTIIPCGNSSGLLAAYGGSPFLMLSAGCAAAGGTACTQQISCELPEAVSSLEEEM